MARESRDVMEDVNAELRADNHETRACDLLTEADGDEMATEITAIDRDVWKRAEGGEGGGGG